MRRLVNVFRAERLSTDLDRELAFHIAERTDELMAAGVGATEARREAERRLGNAVLQKERTRDVDVLVWLDTVRADVRYAARSLVSSPAFALAAILSLALGIGANTAIFSLLDAVVLKALPVRAPEQLVQVILGDDQDTMTNPMWEALRDRAGLFAGIAAVAERGYDLAQGGEARPVSASLVSGDFFPMLGVRPAIGRLFTKADDTRGCAGIAVLGAGFWRSEYGGSADVVGQTLRVQGHALEIVGVTDESFFGASVGREVQVYLPLCAEALITGPRSALDSRRTWFLQVLARLRPGQSAASAEAELATLAPAVLQASVPLEAPAEVQDEYRENSFALVPGAAGFSFLRDRYSSALVILMGLVMVVLVIACGNVANLLLARSAARERELALRAAIGAGRGRIVRQLLTESLLLAFVSSLLGIAIALWTGRTVVALLSTSTRAVDLHLALDLRVLGFTLAAAAAATILFGVFPAWRASRTDPQSALRGGGRGITAGPARFHAARMLVVGQIGLSLALVVAATLLLTTFARLWTMDRGFETDILLASVALPDTVSTLERQQVVYGALLDHLRQLPGASAVSAAQITPLGRTTWNDDVFVTGFVPTSERDNMALVNQTTDGYFATLGTRMLAGRDFDERDRKGAPRVAIVNEAFALHFFGTRNATGGEFRLRDETSLPYRVIGLVETARYQSLREDPQPTVYLAWSQAEERAYSMVFALRGPGGVAGMTEGVRQAAAAVDPTMSLRFNTLARQVSDSLARERVLALLSAFFGGLALLLAMVGLYGVMSYSVARRGSEIGIRMALGCARARVVRMVLGEAAGLVGAGLLLGALLAFAGTRFVASFLYGLSPTDAMTFALSAAVLGLVGLAASALPAWRAARVEPMSALREE